MLKLTADPNVAVPNSTLLDHFPNGEVSKRGPGFVTGMTFTYGFAIQTKHHR
jgi:hypothetical protein